MYSDIYTVGELTNLLAPVFKNYNINKAVLFGSYSEGLANEKSDVDLLVDSGLRGLRFVGLMEDVRNAVGKETDILDVTHIEENSEVDNEIKKTGVVIYEK